MEIVVYQIRHRSSGKSYIGATKQKVSRRISQHFSDAKIRPPGKRYPIHNAIRELGADSFEWFVLDRAFSLEEAHVKEGQWIALLNTLTPNGFNVAERGNVAHGSRNGFWGKKHSAETKELQAARKIGKIASEQTRQKMSIKRKGIPKSAEHRKKIAMSNIGKHGMLKGIIRSQETKDKIAASKIGRRKINGKYVFPE